MTLSHDNAMNMYIEHLNGEFACIAHAVADLAPEQFDKGFNEYKEELKQEGFNLEV
jgi:hypothetical protein